MNKYYANEDCYISNKRIFEAYFTEVKKEPNVFEKGIDRLLSVLTALLLALSSAKACRIAKAITVAFGLLGFAGLIGSMERGAISLGWGFLLASLLLGLEYLLLKKISRKHQKD